MDEPSIPYVFVRYGKALLLLTADEYAVCVQRGKQFLRAARSAGRELKRHRQQELAAFRTRYGNEGDV